MRADVAWGQIQGARPSQQDSAACLAWPNGLHLLLLADGIGGHEGGGTASRTVVESFRRGFTEAPDSAVRDRLMWALQVSNDAIYDRIEAEPELAGMGTTLIAAALNEDALRWVSVGDSAIWLVRDREIRRLNANHSVGAKLDKQVEDGLLSAEEAASSPERSQLLEAVLGQDIELIDAPLDRLRLRPRDSVVLASDGVETCRDDVLCDLAGSDDKDSSEIVEAILQEIELKANPWQDNATVIVVRLGDGKADV